MKVLVTGATGFIGQNLTRYLFSKGYNIRAFCRSNSDISILSEIPVQIYRGDVLDISSAERALDGCDYVFHLAGYAKNWSKDPQIYFDVNVKGTRNVLEASQKMDIKKVIFVSHNVPYNTKLDKITSKEAPKQVRGKHFGSKLARRVINAYHPVLAVGGHIHESVGKQKLGKTLVLNPGSATEGKAMIVDIEDKGKIKVKVIK